MSGLTKRQMDCLKFIKGFIRKNGFSPSYEEIADAIGLKHKSRAFYIVRALERRGHVSFLAKCNRSIEIIQHSCPKCGFVNSAGAP